ncbi:hypothetical protein CLV62_1573 [Dysgonomonas alginatilytica]|uniref:Lipoprotein n=1 Tax=Dysgonomonas alginatilytica TaxID=1605892 RepID=A0A2V3PJR1_9BACT|nr:hypothetical protein [Dysgonomonas alginatilytica]PXV57123.1 hypothetical protein CLV62_1573 [Dysgonomonas alginatilytica]
MKRIGYLFGIMLFFSSCGSTYFFSTIDSASKNTVKDEQGRFVIQNDSLDIYYSFNGDNGPILITVHNKGKEPLYIDWKRSSIIIDDISTSYMGKTMALSGSANINTIGDSFYNNSQSSASFNGAITKEPESISFIPPNSKIQYKTTNLSNLNFNKIDELSYNKRTNIDSNGNIVPVKAANFRSEDSPLHFRSYLTLYKDPQRPFSLEQEFYISSLIKTNRIGPSNMHNFFSDSDDLFYSKAR